MKFSDIQPEQWEEHQRYLDTCLLPLTGLTGLEAPHEVTNGLQALREIMDEIEIPFAGRIVTYPAIQYVFQQADFVHAVNEICANLKKQHFQYVIIVTADPEIATFHFANADLMISPPSETDDTRSKTSVSAQIQNMWSRKSAEME